MSYWLTEILHRLELGHGSQKDIDLLLDVCDNISGKSFCPLGDAATSPIVSSIKLFRAEYEAHVREGRCPFKHHAEPDYPEAGVQSLQAGAR